jgi:hypothetical protein
MSFYRREVLSRPPNVVLPELHNELLLRIIPLEDESRPSDRKCSIRNFNVLCRIAFDMRLFAVHGGALINYSNFIFNVLLGNFTDAVLVVHRTSILYGWKIQK